MERVELFRVLADEGRLRLLALCAVEELTVGELALLLGESQPQVTKKSQPLRDAGLLVARKDGTRTLLSTVPTDDVVVRAALDEGRAFCLKDGSLARVAHVVAQREEGSWRFFAESKSSGPVSVDIGAVLPMLPAFAPLLPGRALAVDVGAGEGALLPLLSPLFDRVVALDRSPARLARCAEQAAALGLANVRLLEGDVDAPHVVEEIDSRGRADLVLAARVLRYAARPQDVVASCARLAKSGGHVVIVDALPHDDERRREMGEVWLGFEEKKLRGFIEQAQLDVVAQSPLRGLTDEPALQFIVGRKT